MYSFSSIGESWVEVDIVDQIDLLNFYNTPKKLFRGVIFKFENLPKVSYEELHLILFFVIISFSFALEYIVLQIPYGLTSADIDLDNDIDVIVGSRNNAAQDTISIFINNGFGYFDIIYLEKEILHYIKCRKNNNDVLPDLVTKILEDYRIVYYANEGN